MALAGFSLTLALVTNYVETGKIRHRGEFEGRSAVKALPLEQGSVVSEFVVRLGQVALLRGNAPNSNAGQFLIDLTRRTIDRNLGRDPTPETKALEILQASPGKFGDLEALVAATEPSVRQSHSVIGAGAQAIDVFGGTQKLATYNHVTKDYVNGTYTDNTLREKGVSVSSFNVNTGYGGVFDSDLGRVVPISVNKNTLARAKSVLSWGLDQYANSTGRKILLKYTTVLALDDTVKKYLVVDASIPDN